MADSYDPDNMAPVPLPHGVDQRDQRLTHETVPAISHGDQNLVPEPVPAAGHVDQHAAPEHVPAVQGHGDSGRGRGDATLDILPVPTRLETSNEGPQGLPTNAPTDGRLEPRSLMPMNATENKPTSLSHTLTTQPHGAQGEAQVFHDRVVNLGWNRPPEEITEQLVAGLSNVELWKLVRRFNKQIYHVKTTDDPLPGGLDLNVSFTPQEEVSVDKINFRANIERLYLTIVINTLAAVKHIQRLRSWRETRRTAVFAGAYFAAWSVDLVGLLLSLTIFALIVHPPSRAKLFPPAPLALVDAATGGPQKAKAGVLGSTDTATGAPEHFGGEAAEQEASTFVTGIISVVVSGLGGAHANAGPHESQEENPEPGASSASAPDPTAIAKAMADAKNAAAGGSDEAENDKTKVPMETLIWARTKPVMHGLTYACDTWERIGNALSPTPPFPPQTHQLRLASLLLPLIIASVSLNAYWLMKLSTLMMGFVFFGQPIMSRGISMLNRQYPNWTKLLDLRQSLLRGVPTDAQLVLTLMRTAEAANAPLPPPPKGKGQPSEEPVDLDEEEHLDTVGGDQPLGADRLELAEAAARDEEGIKKAQGDQIHGDDDAEHGKKTSKVIKMLKSITKVSAKAGIAAEDARAKVVRTTAARDHLGVAEKPKKRANRISGPVAFQARDKGHRGRVYIRTVEDVVGATQWLVFSKDESIAADGTTVPEAGKDQKEVWRVRVSDIVELRKVAGYSWKGKLVVGWSVGREIADGLEISTRTGETYVISACPLRDDLFDRLLAMGDQRWEAL